MNWLRRRPSARRSSLTVSRARRDSVTGLCCRVASSTLTPRHHEQPSDPTVTLATRRLRVAFATSATMPCASIFRLRKQAGSAIDHDVPALPGATRIMSAPSIGLRRHRPLVASRDASLERGAP